MRILAVHPGPHFSVADVHTGWVEAFRALGCRVQDFNFNDRIDFYANAEHPDGAGGYRKTLDEDGALHLALQGIFADVFTVWPDFVFITSAFLIPVDVLHVIRSRGIKVIICHTESPYEDDRQIQRAAFADVNLVNDPTNLAKFQTVGRTLYVPHAYRPALHRPGPRIDQYASDVAFVGTGFDSRIEFLEAVDWEGPPPIDLVLAGQWGNLPAESPLRDYLAHDIDECLDNTDTVKVYNSTQASFNIYRREAAKPEMAAGWAMGPREVELAATGTWFARDRRGEGDELLPMLPTFADSDELGFWLRWALANPEARGKAAELARLAVADRTFNAHAANLLRVLGY